MCFPNVVASSIPGTLYIIKTDKSLSGTYSYNVAMQAANPLFTVQFQRWRTVVRAGQSIAPQEKAQASAQAQNTCPKFKAAQQGAQA
jgi:hypothetical protein